MFDWQAELAPPSTPAATPSCNSNDATAVPTQIVAPAPIAALVQSAKPSFEQVLRGTPSTADPLMLPSIRGETLSISITPNCLLQGVRFL